MKKSRRWQRNASRSRVTNQPHSLLELNRQIREHELVINSNIYNSVPSTAIPSQTQPQPPIEEEAPPTYEELFPEAASQANPQLSEEQHQQNSQENEASEDNNERVSLKMAEEDSKNENVSEDSPGATSSEETA